MRGIVKFNRGQWPKIFRFNEDKIDMFAGYGPEDTITSRSAFACDAQKVGYSHFRQDQEAPIDGLIQRFIKSLFCGCNKAFDRFDVDSRLCDVLHNPGEQKENNHSNATQNRRSRGIN